MTKRWLCILLGYFLCQNYLYAQDKPNIKFGAVTALDFDLSKKTFDTSAGAVVLADVGRSAYVPSGLGGFKMVFSSRLRVKILNKNGFDAANQRIILYGRGDEQEKLSNLRASTFNMEAGSIVETTLDDKDMFVEKINKEQLVRKFTLPALKQGSIFEVSYTITSEYYARLRSWDFQGTYPCLYGEYEVVIPPVYNYMIATQGDQTYTVDTVMLVPMHYFAPYSGGGVSPGGQQWINGNAVDHRWVKTDIPALKSETYTSAISNHISRIDFQLHYIQYSDASTRKYYLTDWFVASRKLLNDESFGGMLESDNHWMKEPISEFTAGLAIPTEIATRIFTNIRDHIVCTDHDALFAYNSLKDVYKKKSGNVAEINLLLIAMLRYKGFDADPGILSTRDNGFAHSSYPLISEYNYVICQLQLDGKTYNLDASCAQNGFGYLPGYCYNGEGRLINREKPYLLPLFPDSVHESKMTNVFVTTDENGNIAGSYQSYLTEDESFALRGRLKGTTQKAFFKQLQEVYGSDYELHSQGLDSIDQYEKPIRIHYDFTRKSLSNGDVIYVNPMFEERIQKNPFMPERRSYDIEMPYVSKETYVLNMQVPEGFRVDEMPKSARIIYNENDGMFEYLIGLSRDMLQLRVTLKFNRAIFPADDYTAIRNFFTAVVKKENEQIVFAKIK